MACIVGGFNRTCDLKRQLRIVANRCQMQQNFVCIKLPICMHRIYITIAPLYHLMIKHYSNMTHSMCALSFLFLLGFVRRSAQMLLQQYTASA